MDKLAGTILVVEDDASSRRLFQMALSMEGHSVLVAANGRDALDILDGDHRPDLVMIDLSMPTMDGADLIHALKAHPKCSKVKVIIVSGRGDVAARAKDLGADGYLLKPVDLRILHRDVARLIHPS